MISGLAPAAQGGNRTGRVLTGDLTAKFLMRALYEKGLSNQPNSDHRNDGLIMYGCYMTAVVKCVPPKDKPTLEECANCHPYLENELFLLKDVKIILALGKIAFDGYLRYARLQGYSTKGIKFGHGTKVQFPGMPLIWGCYHPSPRNTNTGKMTYEMFCQLLDEILMEKKGFEKL
jgi:uracil-DNA glycosylase family 4